MSPLEEFCREHFNEPVIYGDTARIGRLVGCDVYDDFECYAVKFGRGNKHSSSIVPITLKDVLSMENLRMLESRLILSERCFPEEEFILNDFRVEHLNTENL